MFVSEVVATDFFQKLRAKNFLELCHSNRFKFSQSRYLKQICVWKQNVQSAANGHGMDVEVSFDFSLLFFLNISIAPKKKILDHIEIALAGVPATNRCACSQGKLINHNFTFFRFWKTNLFLLFLCRYPFPFKQSIFFQEIILQIRLYWNLQ